MLHPYVTRCAGAPWVDAPGARPVEARPGSGALAGLARARRATMTS